MIEMISLADVKSDDEWQAVRVGPETVGWVGPHIAVMYQNFAQVRITAFMGGKSIIVNTLDLALALLDTIDATKRGVDLVELMIYYSRWFAVEVPPHSLDTLPEGNIDYSPRSVETLYTALTKLFSAFNFKLQAELHACETPVEVTRKCAEILPYAYPIEMWESLQWRGQPLDCLMANTAVKAHVVQSYMGTKSNIYRQSESGSIRELSGYSAFGSLVSWQTRFGLGRKNRTLENVFVIRTSSEVEYGEAALLLHNEEELRYGLTALGVGGMPASMFVCPAGDPLEEWIDGQVFSLSGFLNLTQKGRTLKEARRIE